MKMMLRFACAAFVLFSFVNASAQPSQEAKMAVVRKMVDGYNRQNYAMLKQSWAPMGKLIVRRKMLRSEFGPMFEKYGRATIDTVIHSPYMCTAKLKMEKVPADRLYLQFMFNDKAKLEGFGFAYPPLIYRRRDEPKIIEPVALGAAVDSLVARKYLEGKTPFNGSVMVMDNGVAVYQKHFGYADFARKTPLNDSTLYELASCSKQFTAAAILLLSKAGKLRLGDSLQRFIPGFPYRGITIRHLLTHTSGLPGYESLLDKVWDKTRFADNNDVVAALRERKPKIHFLPGERFEYSNAGYVMLAVVIERASGQSYADYLATAIFSPLRMTRTRVYNTRRAKGEVIDNYAYGYVYSKKDGKYVLPDSTKEYIRVIYQDAITGDGTVNSCTADLLKWERELLEHRLLDEDLLRQATSNQKTNNGQDISYGYGFFVRGDGKQSERLVFHTGGWPGYVSVLMNFFDQRKQIIVLSNNSHDDFTRVADDIAALLVE